VRTHAIVGIVLGAALLATGCASPPNEETDAALMAFDQAVEMGAEVYAPDAYARARTVRDQLQAELDAQASRWLKQYGVARGGSPASSRWPPGRPSRTPSRRRALSGTTPR